DYAPGTSVTVEAIPNVGYQFASWNDGVTDFVRTVVMNSDITLVAYFEPTSVGEDHQPAFGVYPNPAHNTLLFTGIETDTEVSVYNAMGAFVKRVAISANEEVNISDLSAGLYLARVGNACVRFVVQ
ncbi:MAG: T9SS type A sorting domain-containing protein, partial [Bacteroidales bacterium]|nr:T9SS type A sorting domain-containing protein [Bacteroidales bacterium]